MNTVTKKLSSLNIQTFRGINNLTLNNFSDVNIIVGANNSGKTSILEAIKILSSPLDIGILYRTIILRVPVSTKARRNNIVNYFSSGFTKIGDNNDNYLIKIGAIINDHKCCYESNGRIAHSINSDGEEKRLFEGDIKLIYDDLPKYENFSLYDGMETEFQSVFKQIYKAYYLHSHVNYYYASVKLLNNYLINERKQDLISIIQTFDETVDDISIVGEDIYLHNNSTGTIPLFSYGTGLQKAVMLTIALAHCKNGIILIDEIDNAIHISAFETLFKWFTQACIKWNVQAFVTTHSIEALDTIIDYKDYSDNIRVITLRKNDKTKNNYAKIRTGAQAYDDRCNYRMELRI